MWFIWDENKNTTNFKKHGVDFDTAKLVFSDPLALTLHNYYPHEERWQTVGMIGQTAVLVVHTTTEDAADNEEIVRIISARKATSQERKVYEEDF